ncbi:MAG: OmpH family outer membrane protein [Muribaculaceae bacterium]|nr:OmpH family outer membrane protein [Muribaculaceae bacterium]
MKKSALLAAAIIASATTVTSCGGSDKVEGNGNQSAPAKEAVEGTTNIRWYDLDSVSNNYKLVELLNSEAEAAMNSYQSFARQKSSEIAALQKKIEDKMRNNGYLSEESYNNDMRDYQNKANSAQSAIAQREQQIAEQAASQQKQLLDSLENFLNDYATSKGFDVILIKTPGTHLAPELDIPADIISGLNARYKAPAEAAK